MDKNFWAATTPAPPYCVVIPAHDEEATIARTLTHIGQPEPGRMRIIVVCNACSDRTADVVRATMPEAELIELAEAGKWRAINAGFNAAGEGIVLVVDADIEVSRKALDELARELERPGVRAASPGVVFDLSFTDRWVRAYYKIFSRHPYLRVGVGGAGVYGLSIEGRRSIPQFPPLISDDGYVRSRIPMRYQRRVSRGLDGRRVKSRVRPPRSLMQLLRVEARWRQGDVELSKLAHVRKHESHPLWAMLGEGKVTHGDAARYLMVKLIGRIMRIITPLDPQRGWKKDISSRD